jgi:NAD(P)-dependent dehydrogenase (short-subunit alcohol dehydrogenase family)
MNSVLITGASTGIGEASAIYLALRGWRVFAGVRRNVDGRRLGKAAAGITPLILDVTKPNQISQAIKEINKLVGKHGLQGLVNNAGIAISGPLEFLPMSELRRQLEVNFLGQVELTQACLPLLRAGRGRVVNISSIGGRIVAPFLVPYSMSKFALEAYSDGLRRELLPWELYVASVQAGSIDTPIWKKSLHKADQLRAGLPRRAEALYGPAMERARQRAMDSAARGLPAEDVAHLVEHILTTRRPLARYAIGRGTRQALWLARWIPDTWLDWLMARVLYQ